MNILFETRPTSFFSVQIYYICRAKNVVIQNKKYSFNIYLRVFGTELLVETALTCRTAKINCTCFTYTYKYFTRTKLLRNLLLLLYVLRILRICVSAVSYQGPIRNAKRKFSGIFVQRTPLLSCTSIGWADPALDKLLTESVVIDGFDIFFSNTYITVAFDTVLVNVLVPLCVAGGCRTYT